MIFYWESCNARCILYPNHGSWWLTVLNASATTTAIANVLCMVLGTLPLAPVTVGASCSFLESPESFRVTYLPLYLQQKNGSSSYFTFPHIWNIKRAAFHSKQIIVSRIDFGPFIHEGLSRNGPRFSSYVWKGSATNKQILTGAMHAQHTFRQISFPSSSKRPHFTLWPQPNTYTASCVHVSENYENGKIHASRPTRRIRATRLFRSLSVLNKSWALPYSSTYFIISMIIVIQQSFPLTNLFWKMEYNTYHFELYFVVVAKACWHLKN